MYYKCVMVIMIGVCTIKLWLLAYLAIVISEPRKGLLNLAIYRIVNYDSKVPCKLKLALMTVNYDCETFMVTSRELLQKGKAQYI